MILIADLKEVDIASVIKKIEAIWALLFIRGRIVIRSKAIPTSTTA
jgi:hypothetical protein